MKPSIMCLNQHILLVCLHTEASLDAGLSAYNEFIFALKSSAFTGIYHCTPVVSCTACLNCLCSIQYEEMY